jgi:hypothetical protein
MKKNQLDTSRGLKRIYFVVAGLWIAFITLMAVADFSFCVIHGDKISITGEKNIDSWECDDFNTMTLIFQWMVMSGLVYPVYYFLRWIGAGFNKK